MTKEKSEIISFRLSAKDFEPYKKQIEKQGISKSHFFRSIFENANVSFKIDHEDMAKKELRKKTLFYFNKTSNNINQIARQINIAAKIGELSGEELKDFLIVLKSIRDNFIRNI